jgi:hypothetical protein
VRQAIEQAVTDFKNAVMKMQGMTVVDKEKEAS